MRAVILAAILAKWPEVFATIVVVLLHGLRLLLGDVPRLLLRLLAVSLLGWKCPRLFRLQTNWFAV